MIVINKVVNTILSILNVRWGEEGSELSSFNTVGSMTCAVTPLANPEATAGALFKLLNEPEWHAQCSEAIKRRVARYYNKKDLDRTYRDLYQSLLDSAEQREEAAV